MAEKIGTSASFITQLFSGDRKPNWSILAKMSLELDLYFKVSTEVQFREKVKEELQRYGVFEGGSEMQLAEPKDEYGKISE